MIFPHYLQEQTLKICCHCPTHKAVLPSSWTNAWNLMCPQCTGDWGCLPLHREDWYLCLWVSQYLVLRYTTVHPPSSSGLCSMSYWLGGTLLPHWMLLGSHWMLPWWSIKWGGVLDRISLPEMLPRRSRYSAVCTLPLPPPPPSLPHSLPPPLSLSRISSGNAGSWTQRSVFHSLLFGT